MALDERGILRIERRWAVWMAGVAGVILVAVVYAAIALHRDPPSRLETADPNTLHLSGEFAEGNLGTHVAPDGSITTRIVATQFSFLPACVAVPQDKPVTMRLVSPDVIHGILVTGTNVNTMVVPGYVSQVETTFTSAGDLLMPCHEFC